MSLFVLEGQSSLHRLNTSFCLMVSKRMHITGPSLSHRSLMGIDSKTSYIVACSIEPNWTPNLQFSCSSQKTVSLIEMALAHISDAHTLCKWSKEMFTSSTFLLIEWQTSFCHIWLLVCDVVKFLKNRTYPNWYYCLWWFHDGCKHRKEQRNTS